MEQLDETKQIDIAYEPDYEVTDEILDRPFTVMRSSNKGHPQWWSDRDKVVALIQALKLDLGTKEACIHAGISYDQYYYFMKVHPLFSLVKDRCKRFASIVAKTGLMADLRSKDGSRSRQWYLERRQPHIYGRDIGAYTPPPAAAASRVSAEAFMDKDGNVIASRQTAEVLKEEYGDEDDQS